MRNFYFKLFYKYFFFSLGLIANMHLVIKLKNTILIRCDLCHIYIKNI